MARNYYRIPNRQPHYIGEEKKKDSQKKKQSDKPIKQPQGYSNKDGDVTKKPRKKRRKKTLPKLDKDMTSQGDRDNCRCKQSENVWIYR